MRLGARERLAGVKDALAARGLKLPARRVVEVEVELDPNFDMAMADDLFGEIESLLHERRDELGIKHIFKNYDVRMGEVQAFLVNDDDLAEAAE